MSKTTATAAKTKASSAVDLKCLTQSQVSWLVGKPASWLRENNHRFLRDNDGHYNASEVVKVMMGLASENIEPPKLTDEEHEQLRSLAEDLAFAIDGTRPAARQILIQLHGRYGIAVKSFFADLCLSEVERIEGRFPNFATKKKPTPESIRAEAERQIEQLPQWGAFQERRVVNQCEHCFKYHWGPGWEEPPLPEGYVSLRETCPDCETKQIKSNSK